MSGRHRGGGTRGISTTVIVLALSAVLIILATIGWFRLRDRSDNQATAAAETCVEGDAVLHIAADPLIAPALTALADRWTAETPRVIRDHCVTAEITPTDSTPATTALAAGTWNPALGPEPALWVPLDSRHTTAATAALDGQPRSLATTPVVLAVPTDLDRALTAAAITWQDVPTLQGDTTARTAVALPTGTRTYATALTLEAVATAVTGGDTGPLTRERAESPAALDALSTLAIGANGLGATAGPTTDDALTALAARPDSAAAYAVPVLEQQLLRAAADGRARGLTGHLPRGAAPVADFPAAILGTPGIDETLARAAAEFTDYVRRPAQSAVLTDQGFRVDDAPPTPTGDLTLPRLDTVLAPTSPDVTAALLETRLDPAVARKITLLVDTSASMSAPAEGTTPLATVSEALRAALRRTPSTSVIGMYVLSDTAPGYRVAVVRDGLTDTKRAELGSALDATVPTDDEPVFAALTAAYRDAVDNYDPNRPNSVLAVIDSDDPDPAAGAELLRTVTAADVSVPLDIVVLGDVTDTATLQSAADRSGGTLTVVDPTDSATLTDLLRRLAS